MSEPTRDEKREALAELIKGRSDEEILAGVQSQGVDEMLGQLFNGMAEAFRPERASGQNAVIQYDVKAGDSVHSLQIKVADGACQASAGTPDPPRVTLALALPDLLRIVTQQINGQQLFMSGKLKIQGDMTVAMIMQQWFQP